LPGSSASPALSHLASGILDAIGLSPAYAIRHVVPSGSGAQATLANVEKLTALGFRSARGGTFIVEL